MRLIKRGPEVGYRGELLDGTVVRYWQTLLVAARETHGAWLRTLGQKSIGSAHHLPQNSADRDQRDP